MDLKDVCEAGYIPLDKSWHIRLGVLDLLAGYDTSARLLENQPELSDDLQALLMASEDVRINFNPETEEFKGPIRVGESGTLYRFLRYAAWKLRLKPTFVLEGTLKNRNICDDPRIIREPLEKLLELDHGTSQWASAAVLCKLFLGEEVEQIPNDKIPKPSPKLLLTYEAFKYWKQRREGIKPEDASYEFRYDETILKQAEAFLEILRTGKTMWVPKPKNAEDYCFARAFDKMTREQGKEEYSSLEGHESNRLEEMEVMLQKYERGEEIDSKDHRVVQAIAMLGRTKKADALIKNRDVVAKSWPQFWTFLKVC